MPEPARAPDRYPNQWLDFSAGMSEEPAQQLEPGEVSDLVNWYPFGKKLKRRGGVQYLSAQPCPKKITSVQTFVQVDPAQETLQLDFAKATFIAGAIDSVWRYDPVQYWRQIEGSAIPSSVEPWTMRQYNNAIYACRRGAGLRVTRPPFEFLYAAGIPQPQTATFLLSQQDSGPLAAGVYEYVLTFRNSLTKAESGRGDPVRITIGADDKWVRLANLSQPPPGSQTNEIRIWRSLRFDGTPTADPFDEYYYVGTVPVGTDVYEDKKEQDELGPLLGNRTEIPPGNVFLFDIWEERAWLSDGSYVIWSEVGAPEQYYFANRVLVGPDDGSIVTALCPWGNRLVVGKTEALYYMLHTGPNEFSREVLSDRHGCWAPHSMRSAEGILLFFGGDGFYRSDGGKPYSITSRKLQKTLKKLPFDKRHEVYAAVYPRNSWYIVSIPQENGTRIALGYNYKEGGWFRCKHFEDGSLTPEQQRLRWIREVPGGNLDDGMVAVTEDGHIYQYDKGVFDRPGALSAAGPWKDVPIHSSVTLPTVRKLAQTLSGQRDSLLGSVEGRQKVRFVRILCDTVGGDFYLMLTRDGGIVDKLRQVFVNSSRLTRRALRRWKVYKLTSPTRGVENQVTIEHRGRDPVEIEGIAVDFTEEPEFEQQAV